MGLANVLVSEKLHNEDWLAAHTVGWPMLRERLAEYSPARTAAVTGLREHEIVELARLYGTMQPGLIKIADGINRNRNGGQNVRAICILPALTGQYGSSGGGLSYSTSGYVQWNKQALHHRDECPPPGRGINMNRLGAALLGEVSDPPVRSLFVFAANPAASSPNAGLIVRGLQREDLFTVVHDLFLTDTADYADIVLPATSQLEQADLHKGYGQTFLTYNRPAIAPLGECKSNWDVMGLLALALEFHEPWLHQSVDEVIDEVVTATAAHNPLLRGITLERLKANGAVPLNLASTTPFSECRFPTPSGKVELYSQALADEGIDPLPGHFLDAREEATNARDKRWDAQSSLDLITGAAHHFVSSSLAGQPGLSQKEGPPFVEIHPAEAAKRNIRSGDAVIVENERGWCRLQAVVTEAVRQGVLVSPKGRWSKLSGGRNVNWTTPDALADMGGQSTFHSNRVWIRRAD
jgi:anaerobic selenocysteine-containing dehydrogenase